MITLPPLVVGAVKLKVISSGAEFATEVITGAPGALGEMVVTTAGYALGPTSLTARTVIRKVVDAGASTRVMGEGESNDSVGLDVHETPPSVLYS